MTSFQSELGEGDGIAEELAESQRAISIAEFFEKNKHMLGFDSGARALVTAVKEGVDNSLDACEEADIFPDIYVGIDDLGDYYRLVVEDNGPGITKDELPKVFGKLLYGSRFHRREQSLTPDQKLLVRREGEVECLPIGVLCDAYLPDDGPGTVRISSEIEVPSFDRETHELSWQPVTHAIRHETEGETYEITTEKGRTVEVTDDHSLFTISANGATEEVRAGELEPGDTVLAPRDLPAFEDPVEEINFLEHLSREQLDGRRVYVYGFDREQLEVLKTGKKVRKRPSPESERERTYYRYDGVEVSKDSLETNYLEKGYLPAATVLDLGWEETAEDCVIKTYQVGGDESTIPVTVPLDDEFVQLLAYYVSEGHVDDRQVGFTFGSHESDLIETTERAVASVGGRTTTVGRENKSTRVKAFGSVLSMFLKNVCGDEARNKRVPSFVFEAPPDKQRRFVAGLYQGDGSDQYPGNELSHTTLSETLARQLSVLWNMQGVLASTEVETTSKGYGDEPHTKYRTKVYGEDVESLEPFDAESTGEQGYKRIPVSVLSDLRVGHVDKKTVPDTIPGLLLAAGLGSNLDHAAVYQSLVEDALDGDRIEKPRYAHNLKEMGLLDDDGRATEMLEELWEAIVALQGFTESDMCLLPVKDVERTDPPDYVYDISVPGATGRDENFVVANEGPLTVKNSRGQQGIGISAAVLYAQLTSGKPARITSRTERSTTAKYFELIIDTDENEPEIRAEAERSPRKSDLGPQNGTRIELEMEANMRARQQLHQYVKNTAVVNPHARIELVEPGLDEPMKFERVEGAELPAETEEIRPHPHGVELGTVLKMLGDTNSHSMSGFLQSEFTRVGKKTAESVVDAFRDRYYGREVAWSPPRKHEDADVGVAVRGATANKSADATRSFARRIVEGIEEHDRVVHHRLRQIVDDAAQAVEDEFQTRFGDTVRQKATSAAWRTLTGDAADSENRRGADLYRIVDEVTTKRKDDATIRRVADRLATRLANHDDDRDRLTHDRLTEYVDWAADGTQDRDEETFGATARKKVRDAVWDRGATVPDEPPNVGHVADDRDAASDLVAAMRATDIMAPPTGCLSPITADLVEAGLRKEYDAEFYAAATRDASVTGGDPFVVEAGIAYGGEIEDGTVDVLRFANRVPLVYQRGACATTDVLKAIGWRNYKLDQPGGSGLPKGPAVILVHVASTNVPFTSESKDAIANVPEIESEIELAVREAARELKSYLKEKRSLEKRRQKQDVIASILPEMAEKVAEVTGDDPPAYDDALARIMNNVLVDRTVATEIGGEGDGRRVRLSVQNHSDAAASLEVTDIVTAEPDDLSEGATAVEVDGDWFVEWSPEVPTDGTASLEYRVQTDADFELAVDGIADEKVIVTGGNDR
jgi:DNA topoisomerase-6 subunit B